MPKTITITLSDATYAWLQGESALTGKTPKAFLTEFLADMADPDNVEADLIDKLLDQATSWFPPLMELDEQTEMREEVLDSICQIIREAYLFHFGVELNDDEATRLRARLAARANVCWQQP
jgi:hypothetical protein